VKRPLVAVVSCYVIGVLLAGMFQLPLGALFAVAFLTLVLALIFEKLRPWLVWPLLALAGWINLAGRVGIVAPNDLRAMLGDRSAIATVRGTLLETPHLKISGTDEQPIERSLARVQVEELRRDAGWETAGGLVLVLTPGTLVSDYFGGQPVEISGVIGRPPGPQAEGLFDYREYLATRGIFYQLKTGSTSDWQLGPRPLARAPLTDRFLNWSQRTLALGLPGEDQALRLIWAMTLGWRTAFTGDISEPFLRAGTMHLFAIDGLRIALISGMLVALLRGLQVSRAWCGMMAIPTIWFYTAATGWESSAIRASVMMTIVLGGWALRRPGDTLNSLAAAAFIILLWEPRQLFEASFQLSFFVVLVIALLLPPLNKLIDRVLHPDPLLPPELLPRWRRWSLPPLRVLGRYCALSFAAWVGSVPLSAKYFHLFSPVSTPANIVAVPLGTLALMSNLGALVCGDWLPWVTALFNHSAWFFMSAMTAVSEYFSRLPGAYWYVPEPSWLTILLYYGVFIGIAGGWLFASGRRRWSTAALLLLGAAYAGHWLATRDETRLFILPLNGGHAVYLDAAGRKNDWLVNCGNANAVSFVLKPFLRAQGVNRIPRLALTHGDVQSAGGAELLDQWFGIDAVYTSPARFRSGSYREFVAGCDRTPGRHQILQRGDTADCWQVLHPGATDEFAQADDAALVLRGTVNGTRILLLSDLGRKGQSVLLSHTNDPGADVVIAGLSQAGEPLCDALLDAVRPQVIVVADSEFPATRRASRDLQDRLGNRNVPVVYTREAGAIMLRVRPGRWSLRTMQGQFLTGRAGRPAGPGSGPALPPE